MGQHYVQQLTIGAGDHAQKQIAVPQGLQAIDILVEFDPTADGTISIKRKHNDVEGNNPMIQTLEATLGTTKFVECLGAAPHEIQVQRAASTTANVHIAILPRVK